MNKLILLRHGQSQWNLENRFTGWEDVPLTKVGIIEAKKAGQLMMKNNIDIDIDGDGVYETVLNDNGTPDDLSDDFEEFECISNCNYIANSDIDNDIFPLGDICSSNCNNDDLDIDNDGIFNEIDFSRVGILIEPPIIDTSKGIGASMYKFLPSLSNRGLSLTLIATYKSPD